MDTGEREKYGCYRAIQGALGYGRNVIADFSYLATWHAKYRALTWHAGGDLSYHGRTLATSNCCANSKPRDRYCEQKLALHG